MTNNKKQSSNSTANHLSFYHQNEALLFQFLLHESLRTHKALIKKPETSLLAHVIGDFKASSSKNWLDPSGHLPKLVHYYTLFLSHFNSPPTPLCQSLGETIEKACATAKKCYTQLEQCSEDHAKTYTQLRKEIRTLVKLLFEKLPEYSENPSVLYFLLKYREELDSLFRKPIIKITFLNFFPKGAVQAQNFFSEKFSKKGFDHLIPSVEEILLNLELDGR